jgi:hypothetical protein
VCFSIDDTNEANELHCYQATREIKPIFRVIPMALGNATFGGFMVGRVSRLPSNDLPTQARRLRYIQPKFGSWRFGIGVEVACGMVDGIKSLV